MGVEDLYFLSGPMVIVLSIWIAPPIMVRDNYLQGASWFIKPSGCNPEFWVAHGAIPPPFQAAYPGKTSVADPSGANWWTDGEAGWRLFYARTGNKSKKRFGLCPSYFGSSSDINCISFAPKKKDDDWYPVPRQTFEAMDFGYNAADYAQYNISGAAPFDIAVDRDSMLSAFDNWVELSSMLSVYSTFDITKFLWQAALPIIAVFVSHLFLSCFDIGNKSERDKNDMRETFMAFFGSIGALLALWLPGGMATAIWTRTLKQEAFSKPQNWQGMFPYCSEIEVTSFMDHSYSEGVSEDDEEKGFYEYGTYIWGVSIWYLLLASIASLVFVPLFMISVAKILVLFCPCLEFLLGSSSSSSSSSQHSEESFKDLHRKIQKDVELYNKRLAAFCANKDADLSEKREFQGYELKSWMNKLATFECTLSQLNGKSWADFFVGSPIAREVFSEGMMSLLADEERKCFFMWQIRVGDLVQWVFPWKLSFKESDGNARYFREDITEREGGCMAFGRVLDVQDSDNSTSGVTGKGMAPNRKLMIQWLHFPSEGEENPLVQKGQKDYEAPIFKHELDFPYLSVCRVVSKEDLRVKKGHIEALERAKREPEKREHHEGLHSALEFLRDQCWLVDSNAMASVTKDDIPVAGMA